MSLNRSVFFTILTQLPTMLLGFVTGVLMTRILGPHGRGVYALFQSDIELFVLVLNVTYSTAVVQFVSNGRIRIERMIGIGVLSIAASTTLLALFLAACVAVVDKPVLFPEGHASWLYVAYLLVGHFVGLTAAYISAVFQGRSNFKAVNMAALMNATINLVLFGTLFALSQRRLAHVGIEEVLLTSITALVLNLVLWISFYWRAIRVVPQFAFSMRDDLMPLISFGLLIQVAHVLNFLNYRLDTWIVNYFQGPAQLGYYSLAANLAQMVWLISNPLSTVLYPHLASGQDRKQAEANFAYFSRFNTTAVFLVTLAMAGTVGYLVPRIYGPEFSQSVAPLRILLVGAILTSITKVFATMTLAAGEVRANLIATAIGLSLTVPLDFLLIPRLGIIGASVASVISYLGVLGWVLYTLFSKVGLPFKNYYLITVTDLRLVTARMRESFATPS